MKIEDFLHKRFQALMTADYAVVFASYHEQAPFRQQFASCEDYLDFARRQLVQVKVLTWQFLGQREAATGQVECLLSMELEVGTVRQPYYELALLIQDHSGWHYHSAQKLTAEDFSGSPGQIDFRHFDDASPKIRF